MEIRNDFKELLGLFSVRSPQDNKHKADTGKVPGQYGQTPVCFISREDFIANKRATGRKKDAADIEALGE
jgi:hypothetical protein